MKIVSDSAMDLAEEQLKDLDITCARLRFTLDGKTYTSGVDIQPAEFYDLISSTESFPTTSQPSSGEFAELYRELAKSGEEILSIHISSGLSGTMDSARTGASMVPEAKVTFFDSHTLSCPLGWQVQAAALAAKVGWSKDKIVSKLSEISAKTEAMFTVATLKYLVHGGRISHIKGLMASMLNIKPIIGVEKERGTYVTYGQDFTLKRSIQKMANKVLNWNPEGSKLRVQPLHGKNPEGAALMVEELKKHFELVLEPLTSIAPVLGAHTGPGLVGLAVAPFDTFSGLL
jgi:DegV family protein with EDD domain